MYTCNAHVWAIALTKHRNNSLSPDTQQKKNVRNQEERDPDGCLNANKGTTVCVCVCVCACVCVCRSMGYVLCWYGQINTIAISRKDQQTQHCNYKETEL